MFVGFRSPILRQLRDHLRCWGRLQRPLQVRPRRQRKGQGVRIQVRKIRSSSGKYSKKNSYQGNNNARLSIFSICCCKTKIQWVSEYRQMAVQYQTNSASNLFLPFEYKTSSVSRSPLYVFCNNQSHNYYNCSCGSFSLYRFPCLYFTLSAVWAQYI